MEIGTEGRGVEGAVYHGWLPLKSMTLFRPIETSLAGALTPRGVACCEWVCSPEAN